MIGPARTPRFFPGWYVVAGVFMMLLVSSGIGFYGLGVYLRALTVEQGFSVGAVSGATALFFAVAGLTGIPVAAVIARRDARPVIAGGALACGVALLLLGRVEREWQAYAVYALFGAGFAACSLVPGTTLVTRWFARRRAVALSIATTGLSAGGVAITPFLTTLVADRGLRAVTPYLAVGFVLGVVPVTALLLRSSPQALGLVPDGPTSEALSTAQHRPPQQQPSQPQPSPQPSQPSPQPSPQPSLKPPPTPEQPSAASTAAVGSTTVATAPVPAARAPSEKSPTAAAPEGMTGRFFVCVTLAHSLAMLAQVGGIAHLVNLVAERADAALAATAVSTLAVSSLVGRLLGGVVASRLSMRAMAVVLMGVQGAALALLALVDGRLALLGLTVVFGLTVGNLLMLHPLLLAEHFGALDYGRIYARSSLMATTGIAGGALFLGVLHDALGGYGIAFSLAGLASVLGGVVLLFSGPTRVAAAAAAPVRSG